jgi:hypothetical protein
MKPEAFETAVREALARRVAEVPAEAGDRLRQGSYPLRRGLSPLRGRLYPRRQGNYPTRPRGRALVAAGLGVALTAGLVAAALTGYGPASPPPRHGTQGHVMLAADFLARAAAAARSQPGPTSRPGQIYYVKELDVLSSNMGSGRQYCSLYAQPAPFTDGPIFATGGANPTARAFCAHPPVPPLASLTLNPARWPPARAFVGRIPRSYKPPFYPLTNHAYPAISSLPTSSAALRAALETAAARDNKSGVNIYDQFQFDYVPGNPAATRANIVVALIDRLMRAPISGRLRAALYEVIAGLPGVRLIPHVQDALGRYGTEVTITAPEYWLPEKDWIFRASNTGKPVRNSDGTLACNQAAEGPDQHGFILDPRTYRYLGDTSTVIHTIGSGPGCEQKFAHVISRQVGAVLQVGFVTPPRG